MATKNVRTFAEMNHTDKQRISNAIDALVKVIAAENSIRPEAVANAGLLRLQKHPEWGRNATKAQKRASYKYWKGKCHRCRTDVSLAEAKFHHLQRGIAAQHGPLNLVPEHEHCHDEEHHVTQGSLSKGSRRNKKPQQQTLRLGRTPG